MERIFMGKRNSKNDIKSKIIGIIFVKRNNAT